MNEQHPPPDLFDASAELATIGALLSNPAQIPYIDLHPDDFRDARGRKAFAVMQKMSINGRDVDLSTVNAATQNTIATYLVEAVTKVENTLHVETYAAIVKSYAERRRLVMIATQIATAAHDTNQPVSPMVSDFAQAIAGAATRTGKTEQVGTWADKEIRAIQERMNGEQVAGMATGFHDWDRVSGGGLWPEELTIVTGEPGAGKSIMVQQVALHLAQAGFAGWFGTLEMGRGQWTRRLLSMITHVPAQDMKNPKRAKMNQNVLVRIAESQILINDLPLHASESTSWTLAGLRSELMRYKYRHGIRWFAVDYAALLDAPGDKEHERLALVSKHLKAACKELELSGLLIHSMNKDGSLRGSKQVQYDADNILSVNAGMDEANLNRVVRVEKGRDFEMGRGWFPLLKMERVPKFQNVEEGR